MNKSESNRELARVAELKQGAEAVEFILAALLKDLTAWAAPGLNLWLNGAVGDAGPLMEIAGPGPADCAVVRCNAARPRRSGCSSTGETIGRLRRANPSRRCAGFNEKED